MAQDSPVGAPTPWAALACITAAVSVFAIAQGLSYPLFTFLMQKQGLPPATIGLSAAMTPLGIVTCSPLIPRLARRLGPLALAIGCCLVACTLYLAAGSLQNGFAWFALRFLIGMAIDPLYVISETWLIQLAPPSKRGRFVSFYTAVVGAGFAAGPLTLLIVGTDGWAPFAIGACAFLGCALALFLGGSRLPSWESGHDAPSIGSFLHLAPTLLLAVAVTAGFEQAMLALLPVYGAAYRIVEATMSALLTVMIAGNIVLQYPIGMFSDWLSPRKVMVGCAAATVALCVVLPAAISTPLIWPVLFVIGATSYGIYTSALIELGSRFTGQALIAGNSAFALMWGMGGIVGPPGAGSAMQALGPQGLPLVLGAMCLVLVVFALYRESKRT
jgi:MFS family permease